MGNVKSFICKCGNSNPDRTEYYEGSLGYEVIVCLDCGCFYDPHGEHKPEQWSIDIIPPNKTRKVGMEFYYTKEQWMEIRKSLESLKSTLEVFNQGANRIELLDAFCNSIDEELSVPSPA